MTLPDRFLLGLVFALPLLQAVRFSFAGAWATGADVIAGVALLSVVGARVVGRAEPEPGGGAGGSDPRERILLLWIGVVAGWVALSGLWGFHGTYALAKGGSVLLWGGIAVAVATSEVPTRRWVTVWLYGAVVTLALSALALLVEPSWVTWTGGSTMFGWPRLRGPVLHPNLFGDWLAVSFWLGVGLAATDRRWWWLVGGVAVALVGSFSSAMAAVGAGAVVWAWVGAERGGARGAARVGWVVAGGLSIVGVFFGAVAVFDGSVLGVPITTTGLRPAIWADAWSAVLEAPLIGVGAAPYLARAVEPGFEAVGPVLWDAHSTPLSVWGQFGLAGVLLYGGMILAFVRGGVGSGAAEGGWPAASALRLALICALVGAAVHGLLTASEDLRHLWVLLGVVGRPPGGGMRERRGSETLPP